MLRDFWCRCSARQNEKTTRRWLFIDRKRRLHPHAQPELSSHRGTTSAARTRTTTASRLPRRRLGTTGAMHDPNFRDVRKQFFRGMDTIQLATNGFFQFRNQTFLVLEGVCYLGGRSPGPGMVMLFVGGVIWGLV